MAKLCKRKVFSGMLPNSSSRYDFILKQLGLFDYEVKVYMTLLSKGPLNYRVLGQESGVPTGRIYQVLSTLESKGFIEIYQEKTKLFKAVEPKIAIRSRLRRIEDNYIDLEQKSREALEELQIEYSQKYDAVQGIVSEIRGENDSFESVFREALLKAKEEVLISSGEYIIQQHLEESVKGLLDKGVRIRALWSNNTATNNGTSNLPNTLTNLGINTRLLETSLSKYFIVDNKSVMLILGEQEKGTYIQIQGRSLCRVLRESFSSDWEKATPLNYNHNHNKPNLTSPISYF